MKVLLINQFFWPDGAPTSVLLTDVARALARDGHEVVALCGPCGYKAGGSGRAPNVQIIRTWGMRFSHGMMQRLASYASFYASAAWQGLTGRGYDVVLTLTTPPLLPLMGTLLKKLRGSHHFVWEMDVYPDIAVAIGALGENSIPARAIASLANYARRNADGVLVLGECMAKRMEAHGVERSRIHIAENWADGTRINPGPMPEGPLQILYSGNFGMAHDLETVTGAMAILKNRDEVRFRFAGGGKRRDSLAAFVAAEGLDNVELEDYAPHSSLSESLSRSHAGLVTQLNSTAGAVVPSKVYSLLAAGRPVIYIGPDEATPARIVREHHCGWHVRCGDSKGLAALLETLAGRIDLVRAAGRRARETFLNHYDLPAGVTRVTAAIGCQVRARSSTK